jgi:malonate transporter
MLLGWLCVRQGLFSKPELRVLGRFVVQIALPALLFKALASRSAREVFDLGYLLAVLFGALAVFIPVYVWARRRNGRSAPEAVMQAMGSCFSNTGYIGYPVALQFLGPVAGVALALNMLVENLIVLPLCLTLADSGQDPAKRWTHVLAQSLTALIRNPMIVAILLGLAVAGSGLAMPDVLWQTVDLMARATTAVALFVVGGSLVGLSTQGLARDIRQVAFMKLIVHPLAVYAMLWLVPAVDPALRSGAMILAAMPMLGIYPILAQKYGLESRCAAVLLGTTVVSFLTITAWLWLLGSGQLPWP